MKHIIVLVADIPDEVGEAWIKESPGTTAFGFYPIRDHVINQFPQFGAGELILAGEDNKVMYHRCINMEDSAVTGLKHDPQETSTIAGTPHAVVAQSDLKPAIGIWGGMCYITADDITGLVKKMVKDGGLTKEYEIVVQVPDRTLIRCGLRQFPLFFTDGSTVGGHGLSVRMLRGFSDGDVAHMNQVRRELCGYAEKKGRRD